MIRCTRAFVFLSFLILFSFSLAICGLAASPDNPLPLFANGAKYRATPDSDTIFGDKMWFAWSLDGVHMDYTVPNITWSVTKDFTDGVGDIYYEFHVQGGWADPVGHHEICLLLPKTFYNAISLYTQFSPDGLTATWSYSESDFYLTWFDIGYSGLVNPPYIEYVTRSGVHSELNPYVQQSYRMTPYFINIEGLSGNVGGSIYFTVRVDCKMNEDEIDDSELIVAGSPTDGAAAFNGLALFCGIINDLWVSPIVRSFTVVICGILMFGMVLRFVQ